MPATQPRPTTRWIAETRGQRGPSYAAMMRQYAASGVDVHGEARFLHALLGRPASPARVLEAGDLHDVHELTADHHPFDLVAAPGNVMVYLAPGTEPDVVAALASVLAPGGHLVVGFATDRGVSVTDHDSWCAAAGLTLVSHHSTWDGDLADVGDGSYAVLVHRR